MHSDHRLNSLKIIFHNQFSFIGGIAAEGNLNSESLILHNSKNLFFCGLTWLQQRCLPFEITDYNNSAIQRSQIFGVSDLNKYYAVVISQRD
jgi:hypothetical protein